MQAAECGGRQRCACIAGARAPAARRLRRRAPPPAAESPPGGAPNLDAGPRRQRAEMAATGGRASRGACALPSPRRTVHITACDASGSCCKAKYYSIDESTGHCGESCHRPELFWLWRIFEPGMLRAHTPTPCRDAGFDRYLMTHTHGLWPLAARVDHYHRD